MFLGLVPYVSRFRQTFCSFYGKALRIVRHRAGETFSAKEINASSLLSSVSRMPAFTLVRLSRLSSFFPDFHKYAPGFSKQCEAQRCDFEDMNFEVFMNFSANSRVMSDNSALIMQVLLLHTTSIYMQIGLQMAVKSLPTL